MQSFYNRATDRATFVACIATQDRFVFKINVAARAELKYTLPLPEIAGGDRVVLYELRK